MTDTVSFDGALAVAPESNKHVLLGNGFSRACRNEIFAYGRLFERADFSRLSPFAQQAFGVLATTDFEIVMEGLKRAAKLLRLYHSSDTGIAAQFEADALGLREVLVSAIADSHPARPGDIELTQYAACKRFLANFQNIYTVNYDLLLYWAVMQDQAEPAIECDDGFRLPEDGPQDWVSWDSSAHDQNIHYLHGGLHIYEAGPEIQKYTWCNTGLPLIDQIRSALQSEKYPLFVAEGTSDQKMARINRSSFLGRTYRSLENIGGVLFVYGLSFGESDGHILRAIVRSRIRHLVVSLFGSPSSDANRLIATKLEELQARRASQGARRTLNVAYFDAASAAVWG